MDNLSLALHNGIGWLKQTPKSTGNLYFCRATHLRSITKVVSARNTDCLYRCMKKAVCSRDYVLSYRIRVLDSCASDALPRYRCHPRLSHRYNVVRLPVPILAKIPQRLFS